MDHMLWEELREKLSLSSLGKPVIAGLAAVLIVVAAMAGQAFMGAAAASEFTVEAPEAETAQASPESAEPSTVFVHVSGAVVQPGLVEVPAGARVADAIQAAGGLGEGADGASVNLARIVADGEQVLVGTLASPAAEGDAGTPAPSSDSGTAAGKVNINTATADQLTALPGVGQATAEKIVADRKANGPFSAPSDLVRVSGIGQKKLDAMIDLIVL